MNVYKVSQIDTLMLLQDRESYKLICKGLIQTYTEILFVCQSDMNDSDNDLLIS